MTLFFTAGVGSRHASFASPNYIKDSAVRITLPAPARSSRSIQPDFTGA